MAYSIICAHVGFRILRFVVGYPQMLIDFVRKSTTTTSSSLLYRRRAPAPPPPASSFGLLCSQIMTSTLLWFQFFDCESLSFFFAPFSSANCALFDVIVTYHCIWSGKVDPICTHLLSTKTKRIRPEFCVHEAPSGSSHHGSHSRTLAQCSHSIVVVPFLCETHVGCLAFARSPLHCAAGIVMSNENNPTIYRSDCSEHTHTHTATWMGAAHRNHTVMLSIPIAKQNDSN